MATVFGAGFINIRHTRHIYFELSVVILLMKMWINFIGQEGMKIESIFDTTDGC